MVHESKCDLLMTNCPECRTLVSAGLLKDHITMCRGRKERAGSAVQTPMSESSAQLKRSESALELAKRELEALLLEDAAAKAASSK